jgi:hypothetical protein
MTSILSWLELAGMTTGFASVFVASPVSLVFAWIGWIRTDRHRRNDLRANALLGALALVSLGEACYFYVLGLQWWTRMQAPPAKELFLNGASIIGAIACLVGLVFVVFAKGRARVSTACAGFFGLFLFLQFTPLAYLP